MDGRICRLKKIYHDIQSLLSLQTSLDVSCIKMLKEVDATYEELQEKIHLLQKTLSDQSNLTVKVQQVLRQRELGKQKNLRLLSAKEKNHI